MKEVLLRLNIEKIIAKEYGGQYLEMIPADSFNKIAEESERPRNEVNEDILALCTHVYCKAAEKLVEDGLNAPEMGIASIPEDYEWDMPEVSLIEDFGKVFKVEGDASLLEDSRHCCKYSVEGDTVTFKYDIPYLLANEEFAGKVKLILM